MLKWIGAALLVSTLTVAGSGRIESAAASTLPAVQTSRSSQVSDRPTDVSAHRRYYHRGYYHHRYYRYGYRHYYRPYYPAYYARPYYYEPYPYYAPVVPFPFGFSIGFGPWW